MTDSGSKFADEEIMPDDQANPDLELMIQVGSEISSKLPHIWDSIGTIWLDAQDVLVGRDPEVSDDDESDSEYEDPSYKPIYKIRDILKWGAVWVENDNVAQASAKDPILTKINNWLNNTESPSDSRQEAIPIITEEAPIIYSPSIRDLSFEILARIVQLALQGDQHIVITMSHINKTFRTFILSTPILWTTVDIMFPEERVVAHLERSGSAPLRVRASIVLLTTRSSRAVRKLGSFKRMIQPHAARIAALEMRYTNAFWSETVLGYFPELGELPNLDEFEYGLLFHRWPTPIQTVFQFIFRPKRIRIQGLGAKTFLPICSEKVISLELTECWEAGLTGWEEMLRSMPSLQVLKLSDLQLRGENAGSETVISPISLLHLQTLSFIRLPRAVLMGLIEALQTPNLVSVTVASRTPDEFQGPNAPPPWVKAPPTDMSEAALLPFVTRNPQLQELDIHNYWMTPHMWTSVFARLHNLKKLRIASSDVTGDALKSLVASSGTPPALPSLTHFTLDNESLDKHSDLSFSLIDAIITTRWALFHQEAADRESSGPKIQALKHVVLRGWNESHLSQACDATVLTRLEGLVEHLHLETLRATGDSDSEATDWEWESQSSWSWASGDQAVVDLGDSWQTFEWGTEMGEMSDDEEETGDLEAWNGGDDEPLSEVHSNSGKTFDIELLKFEEAIYKWNWLHGWTPYQSFGPKREHVQEYGVPPQRGNDVDTRQSMF
ncbi:hypothetical protein FRC01_001926 [Tulasnella sp. 417]|nr:hypothetical protein FRC01_001926 [Tulasnella sp. 417]